MKWKVIETKTVRFGFKTKQQAEIWGANNMPMENEDMSWQAVRED